MQWSNRDRQAGQDTGVGGHGPTLTQGGCYRVTAEPWCESTSRSLSPDGGAFTRAKADAAPTQSSLVALTHPGRRIACIMQNLTLCSMLPHKGPLKWKEKGWVVSRVSGPIHQQGQKIEIHSRKKITKVSKKTLVCSVNYCTFIGFDKLTGKKKTLRVHSG